MGGKKLAMAHYGNKTVNHLLAALYHSIEISYSTPAWLTTYLQHYIIEVSYSTPMCHFLHCTHS